VPDLPFPAPGPPRAVSRPRFSPTRRAGGSEPAPVRVGRAAARPPGIFPASSEAESDAPTQFTGADAPTQFSGVTYHAQSVPVPAYRSAPVPRSRVSQPLRALSCVEKVEPEADGRRFHKETISLTIHNRVLHQSVHDCADCARGRPRESNPRRTAAPPEVRQGASAAGV
jgi:hypothetical protein